MPKKKSISGQRTFGSLVCARSLPDGYDPGDQPNPNLRRFVAGNAQAYDPEPDDYNVRAFYAPIETTKVIHCRRKNPMKTITTQTEITPEGKLRRELQTGLPPGPADVVVVLQSSCPRPGKAGGLSGLFAGPEPSEEEVMSYLRQLRRETTEASWELTE